MIRYCSTKSPLNESNYLCSRWVYDRFVEALAACAAQCTPILSKAILQAAEYFRERKLRPAIIEKDYYVTEALRLIATTSGDKIIFKGGTSLAKGWNLIQRFSEDIDIFLDPTAFQPRSLCSFCLFAGSATRSRPSSCVSCC